jgi:hypothetical protein
MKNRFSIFLIAVLISGLILVGISHFGKVQAEPSITKPSVPEFTVKFVDNSYDMPATFSIDPYTGENVTNPSHRVENKTIELTIKNQPFIPYNEGGWLISFYYNVRVKGHYAENWISLYSPAVVPLNPSNSDYTVLSFPLTLSPTQPDQGYSLESYDSNTDSYSPRLTGLPSNAQIDFQVEAMIGYVSRTEEFASWHFTGEASGWSDTHTLTIGEIQTPTSSPATTSTPTPSQEPQQTLQFEAIVGVAIAAAVIVVGVGLLIYLVKRK